MDIKGPISRNSSRDALLGEERSYLETYRKDIEKELLKITDRAISNWLKDSDKRFKKANEDTLNLLTKEATQAILNDFSGSEKASGQRASSSQFSNTGRAFGKIIGNLIEDSIHEAIAGKRTSTSVAETSRSREASTHLRQSRTQQQSQAAIEINKGQRNL